MAIGLLGLAGRGISALGRRRAANKARRQAIREGRVKKGSRMDIHHKDKNPKNNGKKNLKVVSRSKNRSKKI